MMNLLADERKDAIKAARVNVFLVRYIVIILLATGFICGALYVSYAVLGATMKNADSLIADNTDNAEVYKETSQKVAELSAKLDQTKVMLDQEIRFSQVLVSMGQLMPQGTILGDLTLTTSSFNGRPVEIKAYAKSTAEAAVLQRQFQDSSLFSQVTIESTETENEVDGYPVTITLSVIFNRLGV